MKERLSDVSAAGEKFPNKDYRSDKSFDYVHAGVSFFGRTLSSGAALTQQRRIWMDAGGGGGGGATGGGGRRGGGRRGEEDLLPPLEVWRLDITPRLAC